jgi:hypothetical protein
MHALPYFLFTYAYHLTKIYSAFWRIFAKEKKAGQHWVPDLEIIMVVGAHYELEYAFSHLVHPLSEGNLTLMSGTRKCEELN